MRNPWAREYGRTPDRYIWGKEPSEFAKQLAIRVPPGGRVLDLGCGEGRDSVFFARQGFDVTGLDAAADGLAKAERLADEHGVKVRWLCRSMADVPAIGRFDLVYSCGSIHHVPAAERSQLFRRLRFLTRPNGVHGHIVFTNVRIYVERSEEIDYFKPGELGKIYGNGAGWRLLENTAGLIPCRQDGVQHVHSVERLVARLA
jgi:tellurite methyltransferase